MTGAGPAFQVRIWGEMRLLEDGKVVGGERRTTTCGRTTSGRRTAADEALASARG